MSDHGRLQSPLAGLVLAAAIGVLVLPAAPALADPARARAHFELGRRYFQVDEYRKAMEEFKAAHIEEPDPAFLYNIAECHRRLGENKEALVFYRRFLGLIPPNAPARANVEKRIAEVQAASGTPAATATATGGAAPAGPPPAAPPQPEPRVALAPRAETWSPGSPTASPALTTIATAPEDRTPVASDGSRPFYKSPWFYAILGGVLVAGALSAWAITSGRDTPVPDTELGNKSVFHP